MEINVNVCDSESNIYKENNGKREEGIETVLLAKG